MSHYYYHNLLIFQRHALFGILGILLFSCQPKSLPTYFEIDGNYAMLKVSHQTTKSEMSDIKTSLQNIGIDFDYDGTSFFDNGKLQKLNLLVTLPNGKVGSLTADAVNLQFKYYGFIFNAERFKIGEMME